MSASLVGDGEVEEDVEEGAEEDLSSSAEPLEGSLGLEQVLSCGALVLLLFGVLLLGDST